MLVICFFIMMILGALASTLIYSKISHRRIDIHILLFYFCSVYGVVSALKWYLGGSDNSLAQSLWDIVPGTFIHYGPIILFTVLVMPFACKFLLKEYGTDVIYSFISLMLPGLFVAFILFGIVSNSIYCSLFLICIVVSLVLCFCFKYKVELNKKNDFIYVLKKYGAINFLLPFLALLYFPNELYFFNIEEFSCNYSSFLIILILATLAVAFILVVLIWILPKKSGDIWSTIIFALSLACYLQGTFLDHQLQAMEGGVHKWEVTDLAVNTIIWLIIFVVVIISTMKIKKAIKLMNYASMFIIIVLTLTLSTLLIQNVSSLSKNEGVLTNEHALELSSEENVVVFVLDMTDTIDVEQLLLNNPEYAEPLKDFTFYNNVVSRHSQTYLAIPYLLTGTEWINDSQVKYCDYAYKSEDIFIERLFESGIDLGIYTEPQYIDESLYNELANYKEGVPSKSNIQKTVSTMWKTSMYKLLPFALKNNYIYYSDEIEEMSEIENKWSINNDVDFYNILLKNGLSINGDIDKTFRFYHMRGAHYPYYLSEDIKIDNSHREVSWNTQTKGALNIVFEYINQLHECGIYDNTTIIITSDHGAYKASRSVFDRGLGSMNGPCIPIMFVKRAGQQGESLTINSAPLAQGDMLATIANIYGLDYSKYGEVFENVDENSDRIRYFYDYDNGDIKVGVRGDAQDVTNWSLE